MIDKTLNKLADSLIEELKKPSNFFAGSLVVIPNKKMESWFKAYWLKTQSQVLMNVEFVTLDSFLFSSFDVEENLSLASITDYRNILIKLLSGKAYEDTPNEIRNYLFDKDIVNPTKLYELAGTLASLFSEYEKEEIEITGWQKDLYDELLIELNSYDLTSLRKLFNDGTAMISTDKPIHIFGFLAFDKLSKDILEKLSKQAKVSIYQLDEIDESALAEYEISSSPSMTKEIEVVHSEICALLKENKDIKPTDILVVGNNIGDYENIIKKVFNQDDVNFPYIPFSISGSKGKNSDLTNAVEDLIKIAAKDYFTRLDFFTLINNPLVKETRNITDEQIDQWMNAIYNLNIYRGKLKLNDDWDYIKKRILLSKISNVNFEDNIVNIEGSDYIPYSSIGLDDSSIVLFVSLIDDIKSWMLMMNEVFLTDEQSLDRIKLELNKWFCSNDPSNINKRYKKICNLVSYWKDKKIIAPLKVFLSELIAISKAKTISFREPFMTGVTFIEFNEKVAYYHKHVFFINAGSSSLPKKKVTSEIDLRKDSTDDRERNAFFYQCLNAESLHVSYVGMDLKKDAELFESTFSRDFRTNQIKLKNLDVDKELGNEVIKYTIDEMRPWEELYTRGEYNRKEYREGLLMNRIIKSNAQEEPKDPEGEKQENRNKISVSEIAKFLEEPLSYKAKRLFGNDDNSDELNHQEFEPIAMDSLQEYIITSKICEMKVNAIIDGTILNLTYDDFKKQLSLENKLPRLSEDLSEAAFNEARIEADSIVQEMDIISDPHAYEILQVPDLLLAKDGEEWVLTCPRKFVLRKTGNGLHFYDLKKNGKGYRRGLFLYACSLMYVASLESNDEYSIYIHQGEGADYSLTSAKAKELLNKIYIAINDFKDNYFVHLDFEKSRVITFDLLLLFIFSENGKWEHFPYASLFNATQLGYDPETYEYKDYLKKANQLGEMVEFVQEFEDETEEENNNGGI